MAPKVMRALLTLFFLLATLPASAQTGSLLPIGGQYPNWASATANNTSGTLTITGLQAASAYEILIENLRPFTDDALGQLQVGIGSTPTWITVNYGWAAQYADTTAFENASGSETDTSWTILTAMRASDNYGGGSGRFILSSADANNYHITGNSGGRTTVSGVGRNWTLRVAGTNPVGAQITAIRLVASTGNWNTGTLLIRSYQ